MKKIIYVVFCAVLLSCSSDDQEDGLTISFDKCDFSEVKEVKKLKNKKGTLHYSKTISGMPLDSSIYYINVEGEKLPFAICNMPSSFKMEEESEATVIFSGNMEVLGERVDATSAQLELTKLTY